MKACLTSVIALILICTGSAMAADPGPLPPPEEACANETGAAYGLCNAYCEAMDCDGEPEASATACSKVQDKYTQITGHGLPCGAADCPCSALPDWNTVLASPVSSCDFLSDRVQLNSSTGFRILLFEDSCGVFEPPGAGDFLPTTPEESAACLDLIQPLCPAG